MKATLKEIIEATSIIGIPTIFCYYTGKILGEGLYNMIIGSTTTSYNNITSNLSNAPSSSYIVENIVNTNLEALLENTLALTFGGLMFAISLYMYLKLKLQK